MSKEDKMMEIAILLYDLYKKDREKFNLISKKIKEVIEEP